MEIDPQGFERYQLAIAALRPDQRAALRARLERGMSYEAIARDMGKPADVVRRLIVTAMTRLAQEMAATFH